MITQKVIKALEIAKGVSECLTDWSMNEWEIDGEEYTAYDLIKIFESAIEEIKQPKTFDTSTVKGRIKEALEKRKYELAHLSEGDEELFIQILDQYNEAQEWMEKQE